jgi:MraZ protein
VDAKGRFNLPFRFRQGGPETGEEKYVVCKGPDGGLTIHPHTIWTESYNRLRSGPPSPELRRNLRHMSLHSRIVEPDGQGRVAVPPEMLGTVGIARKVSVVGVGSYMELWNPEDLAAGGTGEATLDEGFVNEFFR